MKRASKGSACIRIFPRLYESLLFSLPSRHDHRAGAKLVPWEPGSGGAPCSPKLLRPPQGSVFHCPNPPGVRLSVGWASPWNCSDTREIYFQKSPPLLTPSCHAFTQTGLAAQKLYLSCPLANPINLYCPSQGMGGHVGTAREVCFSRTRLSDLARTSRQGDLNCIPNEIWQERPETDNEFSDISRVSSLRARTMFGDLCTLRGFTTGTWHSLWVLCTCRSELDHRKLISESLYSPATPSADQASPQSELEMQTLRPHPGPAQSASAFW